MHDRLVVPVAVAGTHFVAGFEARVGCVAGGGFARKESAGEGTGGAALDGGISERVEVEEGMMVRGFYLYALNAMPYCFKTGIISSSHLRQRRLYWP